ncbi:MCE family protein [Nocardioides immobilis]|uniref:MCE family protein n=1 Tax=Nocardioides immobilis TaxID=2049295 RepID=A0A417XSI9_9ACTN|nr:MlaD family protein [Nocardioides immobilis]RHW22828.1 MCE family protein [Nocardioides immobilis]
MNVRGEAIRLTVFGLVGLLTAGLLYLTLGEIRLGPANSFTVEMDDVSGLEPGDVVRVAGVRVGQVDGLEVIDDNKVRVAFHVEDGQELTDQTQVLVRYENLLGDRYLELQQPPGTGSPLAPGATIPASRATPALDLDVLLNGFRPLFRGLQPDQVNELATNLIATLQGRGGTVESLLQETGELTNGLADDSKAISSLIDNLNVLLGSLDSRDAQLRQTIGEFRRLVTGLAEDRDPITRSVVAINQMASELTGLFTSARGPFRSTVIAVDQLARLLNTNTKTLNKVLDSLPDAYQVLDRVASHGNFFNFYLCAVQVMVTGPGGRPIKTPVVRSQVERCN